MANWIKREMDEEEFYRHNKGMPPRHPAYNPFGYAPALATSNRTWAKWFARFILLSPVITILGLVLLLVVIPNKGIDPYQYNENGNFKIEKGDLDGALEDYTKALEVLPNDPVINFNRGYARHELGDIDGACIDFIKASKLGNTEAREALKAVCQ